MALPPLWPKLLVFVSLLVVVGSCSWLLARMLAP